MSPFTVVTVNEQFVDPGGAPITPGTVTAELSDAMLNGNDEAEPASVTGTVDPGGNLLGTDGTPGMKLYATDDEGTTTDDGIQAHYHWVINLAGGTQVRQRDTHLPSAPNPVDLQNIPEISQVAYTMNDPAPWGPSVTATATWSSEPALTTSPFPMSAASPGAWANGMAILLSSGPPYTATIQDVSSNTLAQSNPTLETVDDLIGWLDTTSYIVVPDNVDTTGNSLVANGMVIFAGGVDGS